MGAYDQLADHLKAPSLRNRSDILVIASPEHLAALKRADVRDVLRGPLLSPHTPGESIDAQQFDHVALAVVEVDPQDPASVARVGSIRRLHPDLSIIAAINGANLSLIRTLVREGITDVVSLPFDIAELLQVTLEAIAANEAAQAPPIGRAPLIAVARSVGGCGATSIATHLAAELAGERGTVVVDLDLQIGSVAAYLGVEPRGSVADVIGVHERLDEELIRSVVAESSCGVSVLAAPDTIMPLEAVETDDILRLIELLRQQYSYVVLDLPANWTDWALSAALTSDAVLLIVELSISSLRQAKRRLELFRSVGINDSAVHIVVNRAEKRLFKTIDFADVSTTLSQPVLGSVALDAPAVSSAQNQGRLVGEIQRKSKFVTDVSKIAELLRAKWQAGA